MLAATARFASRELLAFAGRAGADRLVTGHYARIAEHRGRTLLARAADDAKDQSYMLATLDPTLLDRIAFPLGEQDKEATRAEAAAAGLAVAERRESQEACFLAGGDYRDFLERHGGFADESGAVVDEDGREVGRHDGLWRFTTGQRRGLGVSGRRAALRDPRRQADEHARDRPAESRSPCTSSRSRDACISPSTEPTRSSATARR